MRKHERYLSEEQKEINSFIKILIGLVLIIGLFYFLTVYVTNKKEAFKRSNTAGKINYDSIMLGTLLNREESEYYVLVFDSSDTSANEVLNKANTYKTKDKALTLYTADLSLEFNRKFKSSVSSYNKDSVDGLTFSTTTLVKISKGKIVKFVEIYEDIINELK